MIPRRLFREVLTIRTATKYDDNGRPIAGSEKTYPARSDAGERIVRNAAGTDVAARLTIRALGNVSMTGVSSVVLSSHGTCEVLSWKKVMGARKIEYTEIYVS